MPPIWTDPSPRAALPLPLENQAHTRAAFREFGLDIDAKAAFLATVNAFTGANSFAADTTLGAVADLIMAKPASRLRPGATSFAVRNNANNRDNLRVDDSGNVTIFGTVNAAGLSSGGSASFPGSVTANTDNAIGQGFYLAEDGEIVDLNDGYASMRFNGGVRVTSAKGANTVRHDLAASGNAAHTGWLRTDSFHDIPIIASPANPAASHVRFYAKGDGRLYSRNSAGVESLVGGAIPRSLAAEAFSPIAGCDPVFRQSGTDRWELVYQNGTSGHASATFSMPQNWAGGLVRFKVWAYCGGAQNVTWRLGGVVLLSGGNGDTAWGVISDQNVSLPAGLGVAATTHDWTVGANFAGCPVTIYLQRMAASGFDSNTASVHMKVVDMLFGA